MQLLKRSFIWIKHKFEVGYPSKETVLQVILSVVNVQRLRQSFAEVMEKRPFVIDAIVVLPDHIHCIWTLPPGDADFSLRWRLIKGGFSRVCPLGNTEFVDDFVLLWERRDSGCFLVL